MSKETYKLTWTPSADARASFQNVVATVNGSLPPAPLNPSLLGPSAAELQLDFDTNAIVEWFVETLNADGSLKAQSPHRIFTASDMSPIVPASSLNETFVSHMP